MPLCPADRLARLGTETAFAVSAGAAQDIQQGKPVYPFHLGDMNIRTPDNTIAATEKAMRDGTTGYCPNYGIPELREMPTEDVNQSHSTHCTTDNVAIQPDGKPIVDKFILTMMNPGDEVLYPNPGYPIHESQIEFHGGTGVSFCTRRHFGRILPGEREKHIRLTDSGTDVADTKEALAKFTQWAESERLKSRPKPAESVSSRR